MSKKEPEHPEKTHSVRKTPADRADEFNPEQRPGPDSRAGQKAPVDFNWCFAKILSSIPDMISIQDPEMNILYSNWKGLAEVSLEKRILNTRCYKTYRGYDHICPDCRAVSVLESGEPFEQVVELPGGVFMDIRILPVQDKEGNIKFFVEWVKDITSQVEAEKALRESEERYRLIFEYSPLGIFQTDEKGIVTHCNDSFVRIIGSSREDILGIDTLALPDKKASAQFRKALAGGSGYYEGVYVSVTSSKKTPVKGHISAIMGKNNQVLGCVGIFEDISSQVEYQRQLQHLNLHDQLTGLYNRAYFEDQLKVLSSRGEYPITIISFDVHEIRMINNTLGFERGDEYLKSCAAILQDSLRDHDVLARTGGDEFTALFPGIDHERGKKIIARIESRLELYNKKLEKDHIPLGMSMGMATASHSGQDLYAVFKEADEKMCSNKMTRDNRSKSKIVSALLAALDERDYITHGHAQRLEELCLALAEQLGLSRKQKEDLALLAKVHDLGKVGIPDSILFKPGPLTPEEWKVMCLHSEKGWRIAQASSDLADIADLILKHHERWDGKGYPLGLAGEEIPIECRILAIVDSYDAMTSQRPYKEAMPPEEARAELRRCSGTQFDPNLVEMFLELV